MKPIELIELEVCKKSVTLKLTGSKAMGPVVEYFCHAVEFPLPYIKTTITLNIN